MVPKMLKWIRSVRFQVFFFTVLLVVFGNLTLGWFLTETMTTHLIQEKQEKLQHHARQLAKTYQDVMLRIKDDAQIQYEAQKHYFDARSFEAIYTDVKKMKMELSLLIYSRQIPAFYEEMSAGFFIKEFDKVMAYASNPKYSEYPRLTASAKLDDQGSFVWVEESYHNIQLKIADIKQQSNRIILTIMLTTLLLGFFFAFTFSRNLKRLLSGLARMNVDLQEKIPPLPGEFGEISAALNRFADNLSVSTARNELILRNTQTGMISLTKDRQIAFINPSAIQYLGLNPEKATITDIWDRLGPTVRGAVDKAMEKHTQYKFDSAKKIIEKEERYLNIVITPNQNPDGSPSVLISLEDVTENIHLLKEAEKNEALKMLGLFTTGIAHEIRNPLTSVKGFIQILSKKLSTEPENARMFKLVLREIDRLESLIRDLLVYARPSKPNLEKIPVEPIIDTILQMLEARIKQKRIQVDLKGLGNLEVYADRRQLHQILFNLIVNSIQAIRPENGHLLIEAKVLEETIELTVQDNGIGIDTSEQQKIFTPFFTTKDKGTGLGLAISRRMMEDLEGSIRFESIPGEVTRFTLTFSKEKPNKTLDFPTKPLT